MLLQQCNLAMFKSICRKSTQKRTDTRIEMNKFYCCREILCITNLAISLVLTTHFWVINPRNLTSFTILFLARRRARAWHEIKWIPDRPFSPNFWMGLGMTLHVCRCCRGLSHKYESVMANVANCVTSLINGLAMNDHYGYSVTGQSMNVTLPASLYVSVNATVTLPIYGLSTNGLLAWPHCLSLTLSKYPRMPQLLYTFMDPPQTDTFSTASLSLSVDATVTKSIYISGADFTDTFLDGGVQARWMMVHGWSMIGDTNCDT